MNLRDGYFLWLLIATAVVAFGLLLEGPEVAYETLGLIRRIPRTEHQRPPWMICLASVGWLFIVIGVAGEGVAEALVSKADGLIQTFNETVVTGDERDIAQAEELAGRAKTSSAEAADAASRANASAKAAELHAAKAEEYALLLGPRKNLLVKERRQKLLSALKSFAGQRIEVRRSTLLGAWNGVPTGVSAIITESSGLGESLIGILKEARWQLPEKPLAFGFSQGEGIRVQVLSDASARTHKASRALVKALGNVPLEVSGPESITEESAKRPAGVVISTPLTPDTIILVVDPK